MLNVQKLVTVSLFFSLLTASIRGQEQAYDYNYENGQENNYSAAYQESVYSAHWSIYVPLAIFVVAAAYLGYSDTKRADSYSHNRSDALGPAESNYNGSGNGYSEYGYGSGSSESAHSNRFNRRGPSGSSSSSSDSGDFPGAFGSRSRFIPSKSFSSRAESNNNNKASFSH